MRLTAAGALLLAVLFVLPWARADHQLNAQVNSNDNRVSMMDNCLPGDAAWDPTGGCTLKPHQGDVSNAEFGLLVVSPLISSTVGHPSWRNEPSHLTVARGKSIRVTNDGGRGHSFTKVANFGGGAVPGLNVNMTRAPECPLGPQNVTDAVPPGGSTEISGLAAGLHRFQCCFHPWMRATIRVE